MITISCDRAWNALRAIAAVTLAGVVAGCGGGGGGGDPPAACAQTSNPCALIPTTGGTLTITAKDSPIYGTSVAIGPSALDVPVEIEIQSSEIASVAVTRDTRLVPASKLISLRRNDKQETFNRSIEVTLPFTPDGDKTPLVFFRDDRLGEFRPVFAKKIDKIAGRVTIVTRHFSDWVVVFSPVSLEGIILDFSNASTVDMSSDTGFNTIEDGFFITNPYGVVNVNSGGSCLGIAAFSSAYFSFAKTQLKNGVGLARAYRQRGVDFDSTDNNPEDDSVAIELAARAWAIAEDKYLSGLSADYFDTSVSWASRNSSYFSQALYMMRVLKIPLELALTRVNFIGKGAVHSVTLSSYIGTNKTGKFAVYDSNFPGEVGTIDWSVADGFGKYSKEAAYTDQIGGAFNQFSLDTDGSIVSGNEFLQLMNAADGKFSSGSRLAKVVLDGGSKIDISGSSNVVDLSGLIDQGAIESKFDPTRISRVNVGLPGLLVERDVIVTDNKYKLILDLSILIQPGLNPVSLQFLDAKGVLYAFGTAVINRAAQLPDLLVDSINFSPTGVAPGGQVQVNFNLTNRGTGTAVSPSVTVRIVPSSVSEVGPDLGTISLPSLAVGEIRSAASIVSAPTTPGTYYIWLIAGDGNTAGSIRAALAAGTLTVVGIPPPPPTGPDLVVQNLNFSPTSVAPGGLLQVSFTIANTGSATANASTAVIRINQSDTLSTGTNLATVNVPALATGASISASPTVSAPATPGIYRVWVLADNGSTAGQGTANEGNDILRASATLTVTSTTVPSQTASITQVLDDVGTTTGPLAQGATTDDTTPTLGGSLSAALTATQTLRVFTGNTILGAATVSGTNWSFTPTALANGLYSFAAAVVSVDGIEGTRSAAWNLTVSAPPPSPPPINGMRIAAGWNHTCAITPVGGVKCWGLNQWGQLGDGTVINRLTPVSVVGLDSGVVAVAASANAGHTCALTNTGSLWCWGLNDRGQLGDSTTVTRRTPVNVTGLGSGVLAVSAGYQYTCALTAGGAVKCWGANAVGQLGDGTQAGALLPVSVLGLQAGVVGISLSHTHACAVTSTGSVKCWGSNDRGELGDGSTSLRLAPVDTLGMTSGVAAVSTGNVHTCIVSMSGGVQCRGAGLSGELGDGTGTNSAMPVSVLGLGSGVTAIASSSHTCALASTGALRCWGPNFSGGLGDGTSIDRFAPIAVVGLSSGVTEITVGLDYTCALMGTGSIKCWGHNGAGQLGDGTTSDRYVPVDVVGF